MPKSWSFRQQVEIADARDRLAKVLPGCDTEELVAGAAARVGLLFGDVARYHVRQLLKRRARPVEIVNVVVARHFHVSTNDVQLARRDVKTTYEHLDGFEFG